MSNDWIVVGGCSAAGLNNVDSANEVSCSTTGNTATITNFASFDRTVEITVTFDTVVPPVNSNTND